MTLTDIICPESFWKDYSNLSDSAQSRLDLLMMALQGEKSFPPKWVEVSEQVRRKEGTFFVLQSAQFALLFCFQHDQYYVINVLDMDQDSSSDGATPSDFDPTLGLGD